MSEYSLLDIPVARSSAEKDKAKLDKLKSSAPKSIKASGLCLINLMLLRLI